ncbi:MAG: hypothetical protein ACO1OB_18270 [Archangium sp.]
MSERRDMKWASAWEAELNKERAGALGNTARKLEVALEQCKSLARQLERATDASLRELLLRDYRTSRDESEKQRWNLCVQREAMGIRHHGEVELHYPTAAKL